MLLIRADLYMRTRDPGQRVKAYLTRYVQISTPISCKSEKKAAPSIYLVKSFSRLVATHSISSHSVAEMRILQIRRVGLAKLSPKTLLFLFADAALCGLLVASTVLPHVVEPPANDQDEFQPKRYGGSDGSGDLKGKKRFTVSTVRL